MQPYEQAKPPSAENPSNLPASPLFASKTYNAPSKEEAKRRVDDLAQGFVVLGVGTPGAEEAWSWVLEGKDEPSLCMFRIRLELTPDYDVDLLHKYAHTFPASSMTDFIDDYCRWFHLPLPDPESTEDAEPNTEGAPKPKPKRGHWRKRNAGAMNARERRKARRLAGKDGGLAEDLDQEEKEELVSSMTVCGMS